MLREIGICLFLASVGISAGGEFVNTIMSGGLIWVWWGFLITVIPLLIIGIIARAHYKINYCSIMGLLSGACTDPPALAYGNKVSGNDAPSVAYSTVYPLAMFLRCFRLNCSFCFSIKVVNNKYLERKIPVGIFLFLFTKIKT